jgi:peptidylprolyl isomerase
MKTPLSFAPSLLLLAAALPLAAQTAAKPPVRRTTTTTAPVRTPTCVKLPELSAKIPALAAGETCAKPLYTITRISNVKLDYASPLLSPSVKEALDGGPSTFTLAYIDTKAGTGDLVNQGKFLTVHYTGYLVDGTKFDSSVDRGEPITFPYGQHRVIEGWDTGFEGMRIGGKRRLFIPYQLAYGEAGKPPVIPAKSELVFDVEVVGQSDTQPAPKAPPAPPAGAKPVTPPPAGSAPATPPPAAAAPATKPATPPTNAAPAQPGATTNTPAGTATPPPATPKQ